MHVAATLRQTGQQMIIEIDIRDNFPHQTGRIFFKVSRQRQECASRVDTKQLCQRNPHESLVRVRREQGLKLASADGRLVQEIRLMSLESVCSVGSWTLTAATCGYSHCS